MPSLERRVETLEERSGVLPPYKPLIYVRPVPARDGRPLPLGKLLGYRWQGHFIGRQARENNEALKQRAEAFVLKTTTNPWGEIIFEEREPSPAEVSNAGGHNAA